MAEADPRRLLLMLRELHLLGYERLRAVTGMSPSGCHWRVAITPAANTRPAPSGERLVDYERDVAHYTTGQGAEYFGRADAADDPPRRLAEKFTERFPEIAARGRGADPAYARWYAEMVDATEPGGLIIMYADWDTPEDHVPAINVPDGVRVPLPPPGYGK